jgi:hypothetical protein
MIINFKDSTKKLGMEIINNGEAFHAEFKKNQQFNFTDESKVLYLVSGQISVCRIKDGVLILSMEGPVIIGLSFINEFSPLHYIRCESDCECHIISINEMVKLIDMKNIWKDAFSSVVETVQNYMTRDTQTLQKNVHSVVIENLRAIWLLEKDVRSKTSIYNYILKRNHISRSAIYQVIKNLKEQNVIDTARGKLIAFNDCSRD